MPCLTYHVDCIVCGKPSTTTNENKLENFKCKDCRKNKKNETETTEQ